MALSSSNLLQWIAECRYLFKNYAAKLEPKYRYGTICAAEERNLKILSWYIDEIELYYDDCSCLTEANICEMIVEVQKITNG